MAAGGVRGVIHVDNQLKVSSDARRTDDEIRDEIAGLLVHSVYLDDVRLNVDVRDQVVYLSSVVGSVQQREAAEQLAEIRGVSRVDVSAVDVDPNRLDSTERTRRYAEVSDARIADAVRRLLSLDPVVFQSAERIDVHVDRGIVSLTGQTANLVQKRKAERLSSDVVGVKQVRNELEVVRAEDGPSDIEMIRLFQDAVRRSPYLERRELRAHCQRAHLSIYGVVESQLEKEVAGWLAANVSGVVHVNNQLAVEREWTPKADEEIKRDLERKLSLALLDRREAIQVFVEDGTAVLRGEVDTWRQWQMAMDLALEAGAKHPHNLLSVRHHPPHGASRIYVGY